MRSAQAGHESRRNVADSGRSVYVRAAFGNNVNKTNSLGTGGIGDGGTVIVTGEESTAIFADHSHVKVNGGIVRLKTKAQSRSAKAQSEEPPNKTRSKMAGAL